MIEGPRSDKAEAPNEPRLLEDAAAAPVELQGLANLTELQEVCKELRLFIDELDLNDQDSELYGLAKVAEIWLQLFTGETFITSLDLLDSLEDTLEELGLDLEEDLKTPTPSRRLALILQEALFEIVGWNQQVLVELQQENIARHQNQA